ncbi:MAG: hypothetical protein KatS3mg119_1268 [Rhodothalassiaceae bacterium]|nr:MAG: hypothetical protein KatS3mg119_1268 [Rhodothalassiaceae bacterium]
MIDPLLAIAARGLLALLLLAAGMAKLKDGARFDAAAIGYLPALAAWPRLRLVARGMLAVVELGLGAGLLAAAVPGAAGAWIAACGLGAAALILLYGGLIAAALMAGRRGFDCGCGGFAGRRQPVGWPLVLRNLLLAAIAVVGTLPATARPLGVFDLASALGAVSASAFLYAAAETVLALPRPVRAREAV